MDNKALRKWLIENSTPEEVAEIERLEQKQEEGEKLTKIEKQTLDNVDYSKKMVDLLSIISNSLKKERPDNSHEFISKLEELKGTITNSFEKNKPFNAAGVYKDMINQLSAIDKSIKDKPIPVWSWPQYAGVSVRNRNFQNINPATDGLDIGDFDFVARVLTNVTTETYTFKVGGSTGMIVATVVIVYTDNSRVDISTVTKTPITVQ